MKRRSNVKTIIEIPNDAVTTRAFFLLEPPETELPTITGKSGKVHGANTVNTPAIKDNIKSIMISS